MTSDVIRKLIQAIINDYQLLVLYQNGGIPRGRVAGKPKEIGPFSVVVYGGGITFGSNVGIGYDVHILSVSGISGSNAGPIVKPIRIDDDVEIGSNTMILQGAEIGENATVAAGAVVTTCVPPNSIVAGDSPRFMKWKILPSEECEEDIDAS
ncbi:MAG: acyltransferase [Methanomicrobiales archaeon]|nr:acyltransferase [Methanomicrobiales archaeon]